MKHTTIEPDDLKALLRARGVCVIIPTYNNCATISTVIADAKAYCDDVLVVNDGSTDGTADTLRRTPGITLIDYPRNGGKGYALKRGIRQALAMGFSYAITMDADGQHYAKDIATLLHANQQHPGALIVGNRKLSGVDRSAGSSFAIRFANFWFYIQTGRKGIDTQSGYRLYPIKKLHGLGLLTSRYEAELELLVFASWHGTPLHGTPIDVYYPPREERVSHFRPAYDFARISLLNTCLCFLAVVYGLPLRLLRFLGRIGRTAYALIAFLFFSLVVVTPLIRLYILIGKTTEAKRMRVHRFIQWMCRRIMLNNVIPGSRFSYNVAPGVDFNKPHIIVCNHQSHFDLTCMLIFHPKIVFVTKDWVYHNPFYGFVIRTAEYVPASNGIDDLMPQFRSLADRG